MDVIKNKQFEKERSLYGLKNTIVEDCIFKGEADGESPLKESRCVHVINSVFDLRYPLWHTEDSVIEKCEFTTNSRAPFWYSKNTDIIDSKINGVKFLRECEDIDIRNSVFNSSEFGWKTRRLTMTYSSVTSDYVFLGSNDIELDHFTLKGKYSFQYINNLKINNSSLDTKDAFWHTAHALVENSTIKGEYLAWYAKDITFINCKIIGTQPFCYSSNVKLINCTMEGCDFAFENTTVEADIKSKIISIKNPISGTINCESYDELIIDEFKKPGKVTINNKIIG